MNEASNFYASSSLANNPISSWGYKPENPINASGPTFAVRFMGYVPIHNSIADRTLQEKDALVRLCINTVVACNASDQFKFMLNEGEVGSYVSVNKLEVFLNITNFTIHFYHIIDGRSCLLGRYLNYHISHYKERVIDNRYYLGMVMRSQRQGTVARECNILMLDNARVKDELLAKLQSVDSHDHAPMYRMEARLRSTQDYAYKLEMLSCHHGRLTHSEAKKRLKNTGDFLFRDSIEKPGLNSVSFKTETEYGQARIEENNICMFKNFQIMDKGLKSPVLRYDF